MMASTSLDVETNRDEVRASSSCLHAAAGSVMSLSNHRAKAGLTSNLSNPKRSPSRCKMTPTPLMGLLLVLAAPETPIDRLASSLRSSPSAAEVNTSGGAAIMGRITRIRTEPHCDLWEEWSGEERVRSASWTRLDERVVSWLTGSVDGLQAACAVESMDDLVTQNRPSERAEGFAAFDLETEDVLHVRPARIAKGSNGWRARGGLYFTIAGVAEDNSLRPAVHGKIK